MSEIELVATIREVAPYLATAIGSALSYYFGRTRNAAEAKVMLANAEKILGECDRYAADTAFGVVDRLDLRLKLLEGERKELKGLLADALECVSVEKVLRNSEKQLCEKNLTAKDLEISILQERYEAAAALTLRYRRIALLLQEQLELAGIRPNYNIKDETMETI